MDWRLQGLSSQQNWPDGIVENSMKVGFKILDKCPNPILVINQDTSIIYVNTAHRKLTGFSRKEVIGRAIPYPWWTQGMLKLVASQGELNGNNLVYKRAVSATEVVFQKKSGKLFIAIVSITPVKLKQNIRYYFINWVDVTKLRDTEDAMMRMQSRLDELTTQSKQSLVEFSLTPRQHEVLRLIAQGYNNTTIAQILEISLKSVEDYINIIYQEMHVSNENGLHRRVKAALLYLENLPDHYANDELNKNTASRI